MAGLLEWLSNQKDSAANDYADLMSNYPNAQKFGKGLIKAISEHVPSNEDFKSPEAMRNWGTAAALNAPMGLTFIGKNAANWNPVKAAEAEKLLNAGVDPAQVWKEHLIGRMPDKSLFSEIDDSGARLLPDRVKENKGIPSYLLDSLHHPNFNKNYDINEPAFININDYFKSPSGSYANEGYGKGFVIDAPDYKTGASTALHELQHAIQDREGWARGGSPDDFPAVNSTALIKESNDLYKLLNSDYAKELEAAQATGDFKNIIKIRNKNIDEYNKIGDVFHRFKTTNLEEARNKALDLGNTLTPREQYLRLTGEAQARATQDRMNMNMQQRRDTYPLAGGKLSDITLDQLINRYR